MALIEEMDRAGNRLFKWRSFLPLVLYGMAAFVIWSNAFDQSLSTNMLWIMLCVTISMIGQFIRAAAIGFTPRGTSGRNTKEGQVAESLNTRGIYSLVRHPLYLGNFFMWTGLVLYVGNHWFTAVCCLLFWIYYERIMFAEEQFLRGKFGPAYLVWAAKTPTFVPRFKRWASPGVRFSIRNVLKREYNGFFAVFFSFALINVMHNLKAFPDRPAERLLDPLWYVPLTGALIFFLLLRTVKKNTRWLDVEGREYVGLK